MMKDGRMKWKRYSVTLDGHSHSPRILTSRNAIESSQARAIIITFASTKVHLFSTYPIDRTYCVH